MKGSKKIKKEIITEKNKIKQNPEKSNVVKTKEQIINSNNSLGAKVPLADKKNLECGGTYTYMPIEGLLKIKKYSFKYDIWSLGCILFELICRDIPFKGRDANKVFINILDFFGLNKNLVTNLNIYGIKFEKSNVINYIKLHKKINISNDKFYDLLQRMLCIDPDCRISADEALRRDEK